MTTPATTMRWDQVTYAEAYEAVKQVILDAAGGLETFQVMWAAARALGSDNHVAPPRKVQEQFKRASEALVGEGVIRKVGRGHRYPGSPFTASRVHYYSPAAWAAVEQRNLADAAHAESIAARGDVVAAALDERGLEYTRGHEWPVPTLETLETLLGIDPHRES